MSLGRLGRGELLAGLGGLALALSLVLAWFATDPANHNAEIGGVRGSVTGWAAEPVVRWPLLAAAVAPLILAWVIARDHQLSWPRGELTAVVGMIGLVLVLYVGVISRPGQPRGEISLQPGWFLAIAGCLLICLGGATRAGGTERPRKPPGVL